MSVIEVYKSGNQTTTGQCPASAAVPQLTLGADLSNQLNLSSGTTSSNSFTFNAPTGDTYTSLVTINQTGGTGATLTGTATGLGPFTVDSLEDNDEVKVTITFTPDGGGVVQSQDFTISVSAAAVSFTTYATYALMLASSPSDGDYALVTEGESSQTYKYLGTVDGVAFNGWLPSGFAGRLTGLCTDASANKCYFDVPAGDNLAAVTARGWTDSGSTTDVSGYLQLDSTASVESLVFTHNNSGKEILVYFEATPVAAAGGSGNNGCMFYGRDGIRDIRVTLSDGTSVGNYQLLTSSGNVRGSGSSAVADDTPTFLWTQPGVRASVIPLGVSSGEYLSVDSPEEFTSSSATDIGPVLRSGAGNTMKVARLFAFYVN